MAMTRVIRSVGMLVALGALLTFGAGSAAAAPPPPQPPSLGPNVLVFDPSMTTAAIQAQVDAVAAQQVDSEFSSQRYALLFKPGVYGSDTQPLQFRVGYYTEVAGLGASPNDVTINGKIEVYNRCLESGTANCLALVNFWRSLSNLTLHINAAGQDGCRSSANFWAVSQAAPMRRVNITGANLSLMDYCTAGPQYASGGFISDSNLPFVINGSQQQFLVRDSTVSGWSNGVWNQVFSGVTGAPSDSAFPNPPYTTLETSPITRERPFLTYSSAMGYRVFVPDARTDSSGTTWGAGPTVGKSIPVKEFFVATPSDDAKAINKELARGKNVLLTPGIYHLDRSLEVKKADTVVLGLGFPTLIPDHGNAAIKVGDVTGVKLAGILVDAGPMRSPVLIEVGPAKAHKSKAGDPTTLSDVFFRIGGAAAGQATTALVVNSDDVILDDIWAWRADHGPGVGWTTNPSDTGLIVNGDDVTAYGLFVEHFQKTEVIWNGERGRTIMFQNEMPYDVPDQASWLDGTSLGFPAYEVADTVTTHEAWGAGSYVFFNVNPAVHASRGFEAPVTAGVKMHHLLTVNLSAGTIDHVINDIGGPADNSIIGTPVYIVEFP